MLKFYHRTLQTKLSLLGFQTVSPNAYQCISTRFSKVLSWLPKTENEERMVQIKDAKGFLTYCLKHIDEMTPTEKIAALTILTSRKNLDFGIEDFENFNHYILTDKILVQRKIHLLMHRYAILGHYNTLLELSNSLISQISRMTPKQLSLSAWSLAKVYIVESEIWDPIATATLNNIDKFSIFDISLTLWSFSKIERRKPEELIAMKSKIKEILVADEEQTSNEHFSEHRPKINLHDYCIILRSFTHLMPQDREFISLIFSHLFRIFKSSNSDMSCQVITTLWVSAAQFGLNDHSIIEQITEISRNLRLDRTFSASMVILISSAIYKLQLKDPRVIFQLIHWVDKNGLHLEADEAYQILNLFFKHRIFHTGAWKRIGLCLTKKGIDLNLEELKICLELFRKSGMINTRLEGILKFYIEEKEDLLLYGPK